MTKKGDIPSINTLVDLSNLVSIRYALPVAIFDTSQIQGALTVLFADGSERFRPLGETNTEHPGRGEVIFADETGQVMARRWCWRQSEESAAQPTTTNAIITVEAHHPNAPNDIKAALADLLNLLQLYSTGTSSHAILDAQNPTISD